MFSGKMVFFDLVIGRELLQVLSQSGGVGVVVPIGVHFYNIVPSVPQMEISAPLPSSSFHRKA